MAMHFIQIMNAWCHVSREFLTEITVMDEGGIAGEESVELNKSACFIHWVGSTSNITSQFAFYN